MPRNWAELETGDVFKVIDLVRITGCCIVWVPRAEIVRELLDAEAEDANSILMNRIDDVLVDCLAALNEVTSPELQPETEGAADAVRAYQDGHTRPAQAMASSVFTSTAHLWFQMHELWRVRAAMSNQDPEDAAISHLRLCTISYRRRTRRCRTSIRPVPGWALSTGTTPPIA